MKKLLLTTLSILFIPTTFANPCHYFYVSAAASIMQVDYSAIYADQTDVIPQNFNESVLQHSYSGGLTLGYRWLFSSDYFLGAELMGELDSHDAVFQAGASNAAFSNKIQMNKHVDFAITPALMLTQSLAAILKAGLSYAILKETIYSPVGYVPSFITYQTKKHALGFIVGLGLEKQITSQIAVFANADYRDFGTVLFQNFQNFTATYAHSAHTYTYDVMLGITYKFI